MHDFPARESQTRRERESERRRTKNPQHSFPFSFFLSLFFTTKPTRRLCIPTNDL